MNKKILFEEINSKNAKLVISKPKSMKSFFWVEIEYNKMGLSFLVNREELINALNDKTSK